MISRDQGIRAIFFDFGGVYTHDLSTANGGNGLADLLLGIPDANEQDFLQGLYPTRYWDLGAFVQDDFRIRPNLTINLGLRYNITSPANGRVGNFDLTRAIVVTSYGQNAVSHAGVKFDKNDWAPRIGFAWSVRRNTVVRSAFGMFYSSEANIFDDLGLNPVHGQPRFEEQKGILVISLQEVAVCIRIVQGERQHMQAEPFEGKAIFSRFIWSVDSPDSCRWEQAFSADGGKTWETNWTMKFTRERSLNASHQP